MTPGNCIEKESYELHEKAWANQENYETHLRAALQLITNLPDDITLSDVALNNHVALLLDLQKNKEALSILKEYLPELSESHANMAIAIAKTDLSDIENIRLFNKSSNNLPSNDYAIRAYIDWQAL